MTDIAPELFEKLHNAFERERESSGKLAKLEARNRSGKATYREALDYAATIGEILQKVFKENIKAEDLPDGMMYYNIADRTVRPLLEEAYGLISVFTETVQNNLNQKAGIGLKAIVPELNKDRIDGIIRRLSDGE